MEKLSKTIFACSYWAPPVEFFDQQQKRVEHLVTLSQNPLEKCRTRLTQNNVNYQKYECLLAYILHVCIVTKESFKINNINNVHK